MLSVLDRPTRRLYLLFLLEYVALGIIITIVGAALPQIIRTFNWSYTVTGMVLAASALSYFFSTFACGFLVHRFAPKTVMLVGLVIGAASLAFFARSSSPFVNVGLNLAIGLCQGSMDVVTNLEAIHMERNGQSRLMNLLHAMFCAGAILGPFAVGLLIASGLGWRAVFPASAGMLALLALLFALVRFPRDPGAATAEEKGGIRILGTPLLLLLTLLLFLYVGAELGVSNWMSEYFVKILGAPVTMGAFAVSIFWIGLLVGRLTISFWYRGTRQELVILLLSVLCTATLGFAILARSIPLVAILFFVVGLGCSGIYPLTMSVVGRFFKSGIAVGTAATGGGIGSFFFPFLMAVLSQTVGLRKGFLFYFGVVVVMAVIAIAITARVRAQGAGGSAGTNGTGGAIRSGSDT